MHAISSCGKPAPAADPVVDLCSAHLRLGAVVDAIAAREHLDPDKAEEEVEAIATLQIRIMEQVVRMHATTPQGITAKVELWHATKDEYSDRNDVLMHSITDDLEAMWRAGA
jgi:hypothetical protein